MAPCTLTKLLITKDLNLRYLNTSSLIGAHDPNTCATVRDMGCVSGDRLASALAMRRSELWDTNFRLAERIEMRVKDAQRAHRQAHGTTSEASRCLLEQHPEHTTR